MPPDLTILRKYALTSHPEKLPPSLLLTHTNTSITIFDAYPKSIFHFLVLPRVVSPFTVFDLTDLRSLLKGDKPRARSLLEGLKNDSIKLKEMIEEEMLSRYGFKWGIWAGFHGAPSMEHLHLHVLSNDLCSPSMKNKKHYNSYHPQLGFFLDIDEVLSWFDGESSYYSTMSQLKMSHYEPLLKEGMACWRCDRSMKNMPTLKAHLQEEWEEEKKRQTAKSHQQRKPQEAEDTKSATSSKESPPFLVAS